METSVIFPFDKDKPDLRDSSGIYPFSTYNSSTHRGRPVWAVVAMGRHGEIGFEGDMPWHLPEDLRHFKELTLGHPVIMGRRTWLSIPRRPLPGRRNIVLTRSAQFSDEGADVMPSLEAAVAACDADEIPVIIGGGSVYKESMSMVTRIYVTRIDADFPNADTFFPEIKSTEWELTYQSEPMISKTGLIYRFETYESRNNQ